MNSSHDYEVAHHILQSRADSGHESDERADQCSTETHVREVGRHGVFTQSVTGAMYRKKKIPLKLEHEKEILASQPVQFLLYK